MAAPPSRARAGASCALSPARRPADGFLCRVGSNGERIGRGRCQAPMSGCPVCPWRPRPPYSLRPRRPNRPFSLPRECKSCKSFLLRPQANLYFCPEAVDPLTSPNHLLSVSTFRVCSGLPSHLTDLVFASWTCMCRLRMEIGLPWVEAV